MNLDFLWAVVFRLLSQRTIRLCGSAWELTWRIVRQFAFGCYPPPALSQLKVFSLFLFLNLTHEFVSRIYFIKCCNITLSHCPHGLFHIFLGKTNFIFLQKKSIRKVAPVGRGEWGIARLCPSEASDRSSAVLKERSRMPWLTSSCRLLICYRFQQHLLQV